MAELSDDWPILKRLEKVAVNIDELDYLAKRLGIFDRKDFINLTFCCQQATVISDFSDLNKVGREHAMNLNGGAMATDEYDKLDGKK